MERVQVKIPGKRYWAYVGTGLYETELPRILSTIKPDKIVVVSHPKIVALHGWRLLKTLRAYIRNPEECYIFLFPQGEKHKNLRTLEKGYRFMLENGIHRNDLVLAFGGGVVGDLAGYLAASFMRGIEYIQFPTTLMAMVDSSIGGKVGIDLPSAKNAVGSFYQPQAVISDIGLLPTLPAREMRSGMAEIAKYGFLYEEALLKEIEEWQRAQKDNRFELAGTIASCIEYKAKVVSQDEKDLTGKRAELNYGHTFGHALETATGYKALRHGEAVAIGMMVAARVSEAYGVAGAGLVENHRSILLPLLKSVPKWEFLNDIDGQVFLRCLAADKKRGQEWQFILLEAPRKPRSVNSMPGSLIIRAVEETIEDLRKLNK